MSTELIVLTPVDYLGRTPGDIALSINDEKSYVMIRNEGIRTGTSKAWLSCIVWLTESVIISFRRDAPLRLESGTK